MFGGFAPLPLRLTEEDPRESWTPAQHARACSDLRAAALVAPLAILRYQSATTPVIKFYLGQDGVGSEPTITHNGDGDDTITWPEAATDEYGHTEGFLIKHALGCVQETNAPISFSPAGWTPNITLVSSRAVRVRSYDFATGSARNRTVFLVVL